jgi:hypothetical protein
VIQFGCIRIRDRILILRLFQPPADRDILTGLHEEFHALQSRDPRLQPIDHDLNVVPLSKRFQLNEQARRALAWVGSPSSGETDDAGYGGILLHDRRDLVFHRGNGGE